jgi:hypothetical protein
VKHPIPLPLDPRLARLSEFALEREYPYDLISGPEGVAVQLLVPQRPNAGRPFQFAEDKLVVLVYTVEDRVEACVPFIFSVPMDPERPPSGIFRMLAAMNFSSDLARYGVDPEDGEVRCIVVLPLGTATVDSPMFDLLIKSAVEGVEHLGEAMTEALGADLPEMPAQRGTPLLN